MSVIRILHLSDLHFGDFNRFAGRDPRQLGKAFAADLETARKQIADAGQVDLVVVSGDVAERGKPKEFEAGRAFLEALAGELGVLPRRFVFVPGNHDVSWPECQKVEADQQNEDFDAWELHRRTEAVKLKHYDDFLNRFYGTDSPALVALGRGGQLYNLPELRLSVGALNSCERETHKVHGGLLSQEQAQSLLDAWMEEPFRDWLKVVVVHHNPDLTTQNNLDWWIGKLKKEGLTDTSLVEAYFSDICGFEGAEHLKRVVADARVQLVLHGHQHAEDRKAWFWRSSGQTLVLSTGSLGLSEKHLPQDEPLSCRLLRLDTEAREIDARRLVFTGWARTEGRLYRGAFTLDAAEPDGLRQSLHLPPRLALATRVGPPLPKPEVFLSYAWGDESPEGRLRAEAADRLCTELRRDFLVHRDRDAIQVGESISDYIDKLTHGQFLVALVSDKYLRSPYCMFEIYKLYQACQGEKKQMLERVVPVVLPEVKIARLPDRVPYLKYWSAEAKIYEALIRDPDFQPGESSVKEYRLVRDFANHVDEILVFIADVLMPRKVDDFSAVREALRRKMRIA